MIMEVVDFDNNNNMHIDQKYNDYANRKVLDTKLASTLRQILVKVVTEGVGKNAFVPGLDIAGKTRTAEIVKLLLGSNFGTSSKGSVHSNI